VMHAMKYDERRWSIDFHRHIDASFRRAAIHFELEVFNLDRVRVVVGEKSSGIRVADANKNRRCAQVMPYWEVRRYSCNQEQQYEPTLPLTGSS
jgi:hypothetical protein